MSEDLVIVENVSKRFCRNLRKSLWYGVCDIASEFAPWRSPSSHVLRPGEFWANKDISFRLKRGECLGLIGRNGAGKTTLLKMLNGLIRPDEGRITMRGRVGALIALGAGFNPILTGRENIYVNGSVLGLSKKEVDSRIDEIIDFSGIREFIDSPVQSYSSGMTVRLGFAIATTMEPDILILDEVLAVGDAAFRAKCYNRVSALLKNAAVILVTHNMEHVAQIATRGLLLSRGEVQVSGSPAECIRGYDRMNDEIDTFSDSFLFTNEDVKVSKISVVPEQISYSSGLEVEIDLDVRTPISQSFVRVAFYGPGSNIAGEYNSTFASLRYDLDIGKNHIVLKVPQINLKSGKYPLSILLHSSDGLGNLFWSYKQHVVTVRDGPRGFSDYLIPPPNKNDS